MEQSVVCTVSVEKAFFRVVVGPALKATFVPVRSKLNPDGLSARAQHGTHDAQRGAQSISLDLQPCVRTGNFWGSDVFLHILFLDDHNFISDHPPDLKLVSNDAPCALLQSALKIRL